MILPGLLCGVALIIYVTPLPTCRASLRMLEGRGRAFLLQTE